MKVVEGDSYQKENQYFINKVEQITGRSIFTNRKTCRSLPIRSTFGSNVIEIEGLLLPGFGKQGRSHQVMSRGRTKISPKEFHLRVHS